MMRLFVLISFVFLVANGASIQTSEDEVVAAVLRQMEVMDSENYTVESKIKSDGYPVETHHVTTTDGYILTLHRIPYGKSNRNLGKVAYLQHGVLSSSADWTVLGDSKALAYMLADEGYDVWMGNARGNSQSRSHITYDPDKNTEFWQFSWHQIGEIDLPQMIDYVLNVTGADGVYYAGHSQGTTAFYVMTSSRPEYNDKIKVQVSLAPIGFMNHMTSPLMKIMAFWDSELELLLNIIGMNEFLPNNDFMKNVMSDVICSENSITQLLCTNTLFAICGFSYSEMNTTLLPLMMKYTPAGASTKQLLHYAQEVNSGQFRQYDFGLLSNMNKYGSLFPPQYDLSKITAPVYLIYSQNDWLSAEKDVDKLCNDIGAGCKGMILMSDFQFNHLDYMFGIRAPTLVYNKVISLFARH
ncbi:lipase 3-like [Sitophilus oryzae]|uniref:Lipase n=1 Tax=Sitophilus oryzae TaxID=7048 RepID=A0A6J2XEJ5_SITOR|nr:lipase 3-like [Sitophilus oryzae]